MAAKTLSTIRTLIQTKIADTSAFTSAQIDAEINAALREIWESKTDWTVRLSGTQTGLTAISSDTTTTVASTYGSRIETVHGLFLENAAGGVTSSTQLERVEPSEIRLWKVSGTDGNDADAEGVPQFYAAEPLAADTDATAANHGLWRILLYKPDSTAHHYSMKARLRYADLVNSTDVLDGPDSWGDVVSNLASGRLAVLKGDPNLGAFWLSQVPAWAEQFARRRMENVQPRSRGGETVAR